MVGAARLKDARSRRLPEMSIPGRSQLRFPQSDRPVIRAVGKTSAALPRACSTLSTGPPRTAHHILFKPRLTTVYGWFTEGFDTSDLKEAKALLDALDHA